MLFLNPKNLDLIIIRNKYEIHNMRKRLDVHQLKKQLKFEIEVYDNILVNIIFDIDIYVLVLPIRVHQLFMSF